MNQHVTTDPTGEPANHTERAYRTLREDIVRLHRAPGDKLDAEKIGRLLGISRAPVVDALGKLRAEGLVVSRRRVGTFVAPIGQARTEEVFEARHMIETTAVPMILNNVSDRQIGQLHDLLAQAERVLDVADSQSFDYPCFMDVDEQFHIALIALSERQLLIRWFGELSAHMTRVRHLFDGDALGRSREGHIEHLGILAALRERKVDKVLQAVGAHTHRSRDGAIGILAQCGIDAIGG